MDTITTDARSIHLMLKAAAGTIGDEERVGLAQRADGHQAAARRAELLAAIQRRDEENERDRAEYEALAERACLRRRDQAQAPAPPLMTAAANLPRCPGWQYRPTR